MVNTNQNKDQVFISFRGKDERNRFLALLREKLIDNNVNVFTDDKLTGQPLENLFEHIRNSRIAIVIFSKSYAESCWCLDELVEIKKCIETEKLKAVIPLFHMVEVSSVKKQIGEFGEKFEALQKYLLAEEDNKKKIRRINSRIKRWKKALKIVTKMSGLAYEENSCELDFVEKVVEKVHLNLANIAAEEGRNIILETRSQRSDRTQSNMIIFNVNQLNLNSQLISSKTLEALNPEGYSRSVDLKPVLRRSHSDLDQTDQFAPFPFEAVMVKKHDENQPSIDNVVQKRNIGGTTLFVSALLFVCYMALIKR